MPNTEQVETVYKIISHLHDGIILLLLLLEFFRVLLSYANKIELGLLLFKPHWDNEI